MTKSPTRDDILRKMLKTPPKPHEAMKVKGKVSRAESHKGNKVQPARQKRTNFKGR